MSRQALSFGDDRRGVSLGHLRVYLGLGGGEHTIRIVVRRGAAYLDSFIVRR